MITPKELKDLLIILKEFDITNFESGDLKIQANFSKPATKPTSEKKYNNNFPEYKLHHSLKADQITPEELQELGFVGVDPNKTI